MSFCSNDSSGFLGKPDSKATLLLFNQLKEQKMKAPKLERPKSPTAKPGRRISSSTTPVSKRTRAKVTRNKSPSKSPAQKNTLVSSGWLSKRKAEEENSTAKENKEKNLMEKYCKKAKKEKTTIKISKNLWVKDKTDVKGGKSKKHKVERMDSGASLSDPDLPSFKNQRPKKPPKKSKKTNEATIKYGVYVPTFEDIINDRNNFEEYKTQVENAQTLKEPDISFSLSPFKNVNPQVETEWLDCKHLSEKKITKYFNKNIEFIEAIKNGTKFSERHQRYYDKKNQVTNKMTTKDLTYNTSMIVFSHDQIDKIMELLREKFDNNDVLSDYFFKVLVPELCLKIFMDCHGMNESQAIKYLDDRPVD